MASLRKKGISFSNTGSLFSTKSSARTFLSAEYIRVIAGGLYVSRDRIWGKSLVMAKIAPAIAPNTTPAISINKISALFLFFDSNSGLHPFAKIMFYFLHFSNKI